MKAAKITTAILDCVCIACIIITLVYGIKSQIATGYPFNDAVIQWVCWITWVLWCGTKPIKRLLGGYKVND